MGKLYFRYSAMNSGKTTALIQAVRDYLSLHTKCKSLKPFADAAKKLSLTGEKLMANL